MRMHVCRRCGTARSALYCPGGGGGYPRIVYPPGAEIGSALKGERGIGSDREMEIGTRVSLSRLLLSSPTPLL